MLRSKSMSYFFLIFVFICYLIYMIQFLSPIPYYDQWSFLGDNSFFVKGFNWKWLYEQHNEHRISTMKIIYYLIYLMNGWNVQIEMILSLLVFLFMVYRIYKILNPVYLKNKYAFVLSVSLLAFLSNLTSINTSWSFQLCFHLALYFFIEGLNFWSKNQYFIENKEIKNKKNVYKVGFFSELLGFLLLSMSVFSVGGGVVFVLVYAFYLIFFNPKQLRYNYLRSFLLFAVIGLWFVGYVPPPHHPKLVMPWDYRFWSHLIELLSLGWGFEQFSDGKSIIALGLVLLFWFDFFKNYKTFCRIQHFISILVMSILGCAAASSMARAGFDPQPQKALSHTEFLIILFLGINSFYMNMDWAQNKRYKWNFWFSFVFGVVGFVDNFNSSPYRAIYEQKVAGEKCLHEKKNQEEVNCLSIYPGNIKMFLINAEKKEIPTFW